VNIVKLWTYHPSDFRLDDPAVNIDPSKGTYWSLETIRYREPLAKLQQLLKTDQFLWCCTTRDCFVRVSEEIDLTEWELTIPFCDVLGFYSVQAWEGIIQGQDNEWQNLLIENISEEAAASEGVGAWVRFPVPSEATKCLGPPQPVYPKRK
jgi:hypothetical protein